MGFTAAPTLIAAQSAVGWRQHGVVTGTNMFFRSAGSAVGVAVFGALVNATLGRTGVDGESVDPHALTTAVHSVFLATTVLAGVMLVGVLLMPRDRGQVGEAGRQTERPANAAARR